MTDAVVMVVDADSGEILGCLDASRPDLALVDSLARAQLGARRRGSRLQLRNAGDELRRLLELAGLAGVIALEPRRQPELGEQLRVDEVVQAADLPV